MIPTRLMPALVLSAALAAFAGSNFFRAAPAAPPALIGVTAEGDGSVILLDAGTLQPVRTVKPPAGAPPPAAPMHVVEDAARRCFYMGNFAGGMARVPMDGGEPAVLDVGGAVIGMALSPDRTTLAVNGATDLTLRLVDLQTFRVRSRTKLGNPHDEPLHSHLTHGLASTHPYWLPDGSAVVTNDNLHEVLLLVGMDGKVRARQRMRSGVHSVLFTPTGEALALAEGTVDGTVPPAVVVLDPKTLRVIREVEIPLGPGEPAKLHHGALTPEGGTVIVANMGPLHGSRPGTTVAALDWRTGRVRWRADTVRGAGHVRVVEGGRRLAVLGHRSADIVLLETASGKQTGTWKLGEVKTTGHSLAARPDGTLLVLASDTGRLLQVGPAGMVRRSPPLGTGVTEASLPE